MNGESEGEQVFSQEMDVIRENGVEDLMVETRRRVKLFVLNEQHDWVDKGTGHVTVVYMEYLHGLALVVRSEENGSVLLESRIEADRIYQKQDGTLILWMENSVEKALSFQEKQGCDDVWSRIREIQAPTNEMVDITEDLATMDGFEEDQIFHSQEMYTIDLPVCNIENLQSINELLSKYTSPVMKKECLIETLHNEDYIGKLLELFQACERDNDLESLSALYWIFKNLFLLNRSAVLDSILNEANILNVIGCLEYDPKLPAPAKYREFLEKQAKFKDIVPISNGELLTRIHLMYKMQFIQDVVLPAPSMFEENLMNALGQYIILQKIEIIEMIEKEEMFLMDLFGGIEEENTQGIGVQRFRDLVFLLKEICLFSLVAQTPTSKHNFSHILWNNGLMKSLAIILSSDDDVILQSGVDILLTLCESGGSNIQQRIIAESGSQEEDEHIINLVINILVDPHKSALDAPAFHLLKTLIDPESFSAEMKAMDRTSFFSYFYKSCMHHLIAPLLAVTCDSRVEHASDTMENTDILAHIIQLLSFCVEQHSYHSRVYIINKNLLSRVVVLLTSRHSHLVLMTIRLIRKIIGMKEECFNAYIIRNNLLHPVSTLLRNTPKYNMINSACLELFSFLVTEKDKVKGLLKYVVETLPEVREIAYVEVFKKMQQEYDQIVETERINPVEGLTPWSIREDQRAEDRDEESWFDRDDDVYAINSSSPGNEYSALGTDIQGSTELPLTPIKEVPPDSPSPPTSSVSVRTPTKLVEYEPDSDEDSDNEEVLTEERKNQSEAMSVQKGSEPRTENPLSTATESTEISPTVTTASSPDKELISPAKRPRIT